MIWTTKHPELRLHAKRCSHTCLAARPVLFGKCDSTFEMKALGRPPGVHRDATCGKSGRSNTSSKPHKHCPGLHPPTCSNCARMETMSEARPAACPSALFRICSAVAVTSIQSWVIITVLRRIRSFQLGRLEVNCSSCIWDQVKWRISWYAVSCDITAQLLYKLNVSRALICVPGTNGSGRIKITDPVASITWSLGCNVR